jgi:hypothetical protein
MAFKRFLRFFYAVIHGRTAAVEGGIDAIQFQSAQQLRAELFKRRFIT